MHNTIDASDTSIIDNTPRSKTTFDTTTLALEWELEADAILLDVFEADDLALALDPEEVAEVLPLDPELLLEVYVTLAVELPEAPLLPEVVLESVLSVTRLLGKLVVDPLAETDPDTDEADEPEIAK